VTASRENADRAGESDLAIRDDDVFGGVLAALPDWLTAQRWFASKGRRIQRVSLVRSTTLQDGEPQLEHLVIAVEHDGGEEMYQLLVGLRRELPEYLHYARIATISNPARPWQAYDATADPDLCGKLLELMDADAVTEGLHFDTEPAVDLELGLSSRPVGAEQSNTSIVFGQQYILKLFRRIATGVSPDLELHRALRRVGCPHIAKPLGSIEGELAGLPVTYGMLQEFLPNVADGWAMATASVRDLMAEADLHADEVGGDFASESFRLGEAVAAVHADLAEVFGSEHSGPDSTRVSLDEMQRRLAAVVASVPELGEYASHIHGVFEDARALGDGVLVQRIHGDLHLGQVLRTVTGWVLIDFEGEPATALSQRLVKMSPLRDVAGMLRSFDYAAHHLLGGHENDNAQLAYRAVEWATRNRSAFCDGYATHGTDPRDAAVLLRALELDKAVYEVAYEAGNRPSWLPIPLASIARIVAKDSGEQP
jgi:maltokinase